jgi:hypothetical protein
MQVQCLALLVKMLLLTAAALCSILILFIVKCVKE